MIGAGVSAGLSAVTPVRAGLVISFHDANQGYQYYGGYNVLMYGQGAAIDPGNNLWNGFGKYGGPGSTDFFGGGNPDSAHGAVPSGSPGNPYAWHNGTTSSGTNLFSPTNSGASNVGNVYSNGTISPITLTLGTYNQDGGLNQVGTQNVTQGTPSKVMSEAAQVFNNAVGTFSLGGVPIVTGTTYDLFLYAANYNGDRGALFNVSTSTYTAVGGYSQANNPGTGGPIQNFTLGQDYVEFTGITPTSAGIIAGTWTGALNPTTGQSGEGDFNGLQLVAVPSLGTTYVYTGTGSPPALFDTGSDQNFTNNGSPANFSNGSVAVFDDTATGSHIVTVGAGVSPSAINFNNATTNYTLNGAGITGTGGVNINGNGSSGGNVTFNNSANTYTGPTIVTLGNLFINAGSSIASNGVVVLSGGSLTLQSSSGSIAAGALTGSSLSVTDSGTVNVNSSNNLGALVGSGVLNVATGASLTLTGGTFAGTYNASGSTLILAGSTGGAFAAVIGGNNAVQVNASGAAWTLAAANTYTGGTTVTAGSAIAGASTAFGTGPVKLAGGTLGVTSPLASIPGVVSGGTLELAADGNGVLDLSNTGNTFTGPIIIDPSGTSGAGTIQIDSPGSLGTTKAITVGIGGSLLINDTSGSAGTGVSLTISGPGPTSTVANITNGPTGALRSVDNPPGFDVWAGGVVLNGSAYIAAGANGGLLLAGPITGTGPVVYTSNANSSAGSIIELSPPSATSNTYTGETDILPGPNASQGGDTIALGAANGFSPASGLNFKLGTAQLLTVDLAGNNQSLQYLVGANETGFSLTSSSGAPTLTITNGLKNGVPGFFATTITGSLGVVMNDQSVSGLGNQVLSGSNSYTGGTTITRGTLTAGSASALSNTPVKLNGGTLGLAENVSGTSALIVTPASVTSTAWSINQGNTGGGGNGDPAQIVSNVIQITDTSPGEANSAFSKTPVTVSDKLGFTAHFTYSVLSGGSDGIAFTLQNDPRGAAAVSQGQSYEIGYGGTGQITNSAAVAFEIYTPNTHNNAGYGTAFTSGGFTPGEAGSPSTAYTPTGSVNLQGGANDVTLVYNGPAETLTETIATEGTGNTFTITYTGVDYSALVGGTAGGTTNAYLGFTGGSGGDQAAQNISNISYATNLTAPQAISNEIDAQPGTTSGIQIGLSGANSSTKGSVGPLNISSGAIVNLSITPGATGRGVLSPTSLTIATGSTGAFTGKLDLGGNDLDLTSSSGATLASVTAMLASGYNAGKWNGSGIASSAAASDSKHLTALGVIVNDNGHGVPLYGSGGSLSTTFDGSVPADGDILVKYTYYGDANLDGAVDGSDYTLIDAGFNSHGTLSGWSNGDFNYDGKIDGSDYTLIDNAFNTQGASLGSNPASVFASSSAQLAGGSSAVPEPASLGLLGIGAIGLLGKRRRK